MVMGHEISRPEVTNCYNITPGCLSSSPVIAGNDVLLAVT
jgi:hypothetical protein